MLLLALSLLQWIDRVCRFVGFSRKLMCLRSVKFEIFLSWCPRAWQKPKYFLSSNFKKYLLKNQQKYRKSLARRFLHFAGVHRVPVKYNFCCQPYKTRTSTARPFCQSVSHTVNQLVSKLVNESWIKGQVSKGTVVKRRLGTLTSYLFVVCISAVRNPKSSNLIG